MTGFPRFVVFAIGLILAASPALAGFDPQEAKKTCTARYDREKDGGTLPAGMAKSKYMSQCVNGMRRDAELEKSLAAGEPPSAAPAAGSNELAITTTPAVTPVPATQAKPASVPTPAPAGSKSKSSR